MNTIKDEGGSAYPTNHQEQMSGMTLRDYFAGQAMQGYIVGTENPKYDYIAAVAYEMADAMLKARSA